MEKTIVLLGFVQSLFGVLLFISKRPRHLSFTLLAVWLLVISVFLGAGLLPFEVVDYFKPGIFPILFLFGPLLYLYVSSLVLNNFTIKINQLWHLLPLLLIVAHRSLTDPISVTSINNPTESPSLFYNKIYYIILVLSLFVYWLFSLKLILNHKRNIPFYFSNYTAKNTLSWLIFVVLVFLLLILAQLFISTLQRIFGVSIFQFLSLFTNLTIFTFIMLFFGLNQSVLFKPESTEEESIKTDSSEKYKRSALNEKEISHINQKVFEYLKTEKPFLSPEFNLQMMVDDLGISRQNLSQVINSSQNKNFYKLVNEFRIEEVKEKLMDPGFKNYTILGIAFECGFNSKTTFNRIFKKVTGITPTEYVKKLDE